MFVHSSLPIAPSTSVWASDASSHSEAKPIEPMGSGTRVLYVMMTTARQQFSGLLFRGFFCFIAGAWSEQ